MTDAEVITLREQREVLLEGLQYMCRNYHPSSCICTFCEMASATATNKEGR